jgi:general secretion pathway protein D
VRSQELDQSNLRVIDTGLGQSFIELRYSGNEKAAATPAAVPAAHPTATERPAVGSIPSQSAIEAAPQMLAQLRSDMGSNGGPTATAQAAVPQPGQPPISPTTQPPGLPSGAPAPSAPAATAPVPPAVSASLALNVPTVPMATGSTFKVPVVLTGGTNVDFVGLQLHFDPAKLQLAGAAAGDLLSRDGQPIGLSHVEDSPGSVYISASRPPGTHGVTGTGVVCVLTFQAKVPGESGLGITRFSLNGAEQQVPVQTGQATIVVK